MRARRRGREAAALRRGVTGLAQAEVLDGLRRRRQLVVRALTPIVLLGLLVGIELVAGDDDLTGTGDYRVAVAGDLEGAPGALAALRDHPRLEVVEREDARVAADDGADLGLVFPPDFDRRLAAGDVSSLVPVLGFDLPGRTAFALVAAELEGVWRSSLPSGASDARLFDVEVVETEAEREAESLVGQVVSAIVVLQAATVIGGAAARFTTRRAVGVLQSQLLLPVPRGALALAKGTAESLLGLVAVAPVVAAFALVALVVLVAEGAVLGGVATMVAVVLGTLSMLFPASVYGVLIGCAARSPQGASVASALGVVILAGVVSFVSIGPEPVGSLVAIVPIAGLAHGIRLVASGESAALVLAVGAVSTVALGAGLTVVTGRYLGTERLGQRTSSSGPEHRVDTRPAVRFWAGARLVGGLTFRELRRYAGAWRLPLLTAVLFALLFAGAAVVQDVVDDREAGRSFSVAVGGEPSAVGALVDDLSTSRLHPEPVADVAASVSTFESRGGARPAGGTSSRRAREPSRSRWNSLSGRTTTSRPKPRPSSARTSNASRSRPCRTSARSTSPSPWSKFRWRRSPRWSWPGSPRPWRAWSASSPSGS
ncbi:MAG: hypothetical protein U5R31_01620 [Acidimicrobiia bacterium]|nr:hypothetical protein [Acidimicrobiia bacterium]